eukprot:IDg8515t1
MTIITASAVIQTLMKTKMKMKLYHWLLSGRCALEELSKRQKWHSEFVSVAFLTAQELEGMHLKGTPKSEDENIESQKRQSGLALKKNCSGKIVRHKARLLTKGFTQLNGVDYTGVLALVMKYKTFISLPTVTAMLEYEVSKLDVITALLHGNLEEEVHMKLPDFPPELKEILRPLELRCSAKRSMGELDKAIESNTAKREGKGGSGASRRSKRAGLRAVSQTRKIPRRRSTCGTRREARMLEGCVVSTGLRGSRRSEQCPCDDRLVKLDAGHGSWRDGLSVQTLGAEEDKSRIAVCAIQRCPQCAWWASAKMDLILGSFHGARSQSKHLQRVAAVSSKEALNIFGDVREGGCVDSESSGVIQANVKRGADKSRQHRSLIAC